MGRIKDGIEVAKSTGDITKLKAAVTNVPARGTATHGILSNDDAGPIHPSESFDDVTAAWTAGDLGDDQYNELLNHAAGTPGAKLQQPDASDDVT